MQYVCTPPSHLRPSLLALAMGAALLHPSAWAIDLAQEPPMPTSTGTLIPPNVIISIDDSGSMDWKLNSQSDGQSSIVAPNADGTWSNDAKRMTVLKYAVKQVFENTTLIPDGHIRLAWQVMHNNGGASNASSVDNGNSPAGLNTNSMYLFKDESGANGRKHRSNFLSFINGLVPKNGTPSHLMFKQADAYMRRPLGKYSPWSTNPGGSDAKATEYLACRRNYHIMMTDGRWNGTAHSVGYWNGDAFVEEPLRRDNATNITSNTTAVEQAMTIALPSIKYYNDAANPDNFIVKTSVYGGPSAAERAQTQLYRDSNDSLIYKQEKYCKDYDRRGNCDEWGWRDTAEITGYALDNTLADWAFYSWSKPLQDATKLIGELKHTKEYNEAPDTENFGKDVSAAKKDAILEKFWNPRYNPATWPHMVTYTIGFSNDATTWPGDASIVAPPAANRVPFGYGQGTNGSLPDLITGNKKWPKMDNENKRSLDLWHAALNGRGRFYAVTKGEDLQKAFEEIVGKINQEAGELPSSITAGASASGYNVSRNNEGTFSTVYSPVQAWKGWVTASPITVPIEKPCEDDPDQKCIDFPDPTGAWGGKTTADKLDETDVSTRLILSWSDQWNTSATPNAPKGGVPFQWATDESNLSTVQKNLLGVASTATGATEATKGENVLNYIRGDRSKEMEKNGPFRNRKSRQGDIVNSEIWYTAAPVSNYFATGYASFVKAQAKRLPMLYVGGNDGMLHGFSAKDGAEKIAYVPRGVVGDLKKLTESNYKHQYFVDGSPMTGDVKDAGTWKTLLVGSLGAGGKGYFVLDVTKPGDFGTTAASSLAVLDRTRGNTEVLVACSTLTGTEKAACISAQDEDKDIGNIVAPPVRNTNNLQQTTQITQMNNGRWAVIMGNGYNSANQRPVLLIQYLDADANGERKVVRIAAASNITTGTGNAKDNGLSAPAVVDLNSDGKVDVVYAGDNLGNLWKFDLTSDTESEWKVAFSSSGNTNTPLFTARGPTTTGGTRDQVQPITAPPLVRANDRAMVVGTGSSATTVAVGGMMVAFGTGRNVTKNDRSTETTGINQMPYFQTLYSVLDNTRYRKKSGKTHLEVHPGTGDCATDPKNCIPTPAAVGTLGSDGKPLAKQTFAEITGSAGFFKVNATDDLKKETWKDYKGWYVDFFSRGERLLKPMQFYDGSNIMAVYSEEPNGTKNLGNNTVSESCEPVTISTTPGRMTRHFINIMDGKRPTVQLVDTDGNGVFNRTDDKDASSRSVPLGSPLLVTAGKKIVDMTGKGKDDKPIESPRMPEQTLRPSWRQLQ